MNWRDVSAKRHSLSSVSLNSFLFPFEFWVIDNSGEGVGIGLIFDGESRWRVSMARGNRFQTCQRCERMRCREERGEWEQLYFADTSLNAGLHSGLDSGALVTGYPWSRWWQWYHCLFTRVAVRYVYAFNWDSLTMQVWMVWIRIERRLSNCDGLQLAYLCCNASAIVAIVAFDGIYGIDSLDSLPTQCMPTVGPLNTLIVVQTVRTQLNR